VSFGALLLSGAMIVAPISRAGIWEPRELSSAEQARRVAVGLLRAASLGVAGDPTSAPTLGDLRSGELPFVAMAASFRLFGLHPWAGRLALALFALTGLAATWHLLMRFAGPRAAGIGAVVLASTPLYTVHARTMLGDAASMGSFAIAFAGLAGFVLEARTRATGSWAVLAIVGLACGFLSRGLLFGVSVPLIAVGLGSLLVMPALGRETAQRRVMFGTTALALGIASLLTFLDEASVLRATADGVVTRVTAMTFEAPASGATFETMARRLGHALFPWSILVPVAIARAMAVPPPEAPSHRPAGEESAAGPQAGALRILLLLGAGCALAASTLVGPWAIDVPFAGVAAVAALVALALDDLARGATPSRVAAFATLIASAILGLDLVREPDRIVAAFGGAASIFLDSPPVTEKRWVAIVAAGVGVPLAIAASIGTRTAVAGSSAEGGTPTAPSSAERQVAHPTSVLSARIADARTLLADVSAAWNGHLAFLLVVIEATLVGLAAMVAVGRWLDWSSIVRLPELYQRMFLHLFWLAPVGLAVGLAIPTLGADALRWFARRLGTSAPMVGVAMASAFASAFVLDFYPTLAAQLSPREALEAFASLHRSGESLGLVGMSPRLVDYHGGGDVRAFPRADSAFGWFAGDDAPPAATKPGGDLPRRWLVVPERELAKLNMLHRARFGRNLPVVDASSSQTLLAVSDLAGMPQRSPLRDVVLDEAPAPARSQHAQFGDEIELVGWELRDQGGALIDAVPTRTRVQAKVYLRVIGTFDASYAPFLHIDRKKLRFNGDDTFVDHGYPPPSWLPGDVVVLTCDVLLEANFPIGEAEVYFGFFAGTTRMKVTEGAASLDRARLGKLIVR